MSSIEKAWAKVRANAESSDSRETRAELREFELNVSSRLKGIQTKLARGKFVFKPAKPLLIGAKQRPIVVAPIESRIVQRTLLDVVQSIPAIHSELHAGFNFGGVEGPGFGVPAAIAKAVRSAQAGGYFVRSDIKSFFTKVPRATALALLTAHTGHDAEFTSLLQAAVTVELADVAHLDGLMHLFPLYEHGVAQGSCLSPLLCNYLLASFDRGMNGRGIVCIRYIDDFILFAKDRKTAMRAFLSAKRRLNALGLDAYNPFDASEKAKAESGACEGGFEFLGCEIRPDRVRPSQKKRQALVARVKEIFDEALKGLRHPAAAIRSPQQTETFAGAIVAASNVIRGWGNTYSFCSDDRLMAALDMQLGELLQEFRARFTKRVERLNALDQQRGTGLFCLEDCKRDEGAESARVIANSRRRGVGGQGVLEDGTQVVRMAA
jgi:hypothetical protein